MGGRKSEHGGMISYDEPDSLCKDNMPGILPAIVILIDGIFKGTGINLEIKGKIHKP